MCNRAAQAREEGRFPKTDFKKEYGVSQKTFDALVDTGVIDDSEWHHTSMYGNRTTFYGWDEPWYADYYAKHKKDIDDAIKRGESKEDIFEMFDSGREEYEAEQERQREEQRIRFEERLAYDEYIRDSIEVPEMYDASNGVRVETQG